MKAILIARVSTEEQREAGNSLPAQVVRLERYCQNKGFSILKTCSFDESAYSSERNEFDTIIDFILAQKEKVIVCCDKVDRISRNIFDKRISELYERALRDELELHFVSDNQIINSNISAVEKFQFSISLGLAKYYSDAISDNVKRGNEQKLRKGEWLSRAPYGYKNIANPDGTKDIIVVEDEAHILKRAFELYATGAFSMQLLCNKLKEEFGVNWSKGFLGSILNKKFYYGVMVVKGKEYPHRYPPLISQDLFDQVATKISGFLKKPAKLAGKPYIYRGLIRCAECGLAITPEKHKGHIYYHCTQSKGKHGAQWVREEEISRQLGRVFKNLQMPEYILQQTVEVLNVVHKDKMDFHNKQFDKLTNEQKSLTKMIDNLYMDKLKGNIDNSQYERYYVELRNQLDDINSRLNRLQNAEDNYYIMAKSILDLVNRAYELFLGSEVEEKRQLINLILQNLKLDGKKLLYDVQKPFDLIVDCLDRQSWCA